MKALEAIDRFEEYAGKVEFLAPLVEEAERLREKLMKGQLNVVFVGEFSSGKTSLINALFGLNLPVDVLPETSAIWRLITTKGEEKIQVFLTDDQVMKAESLEEVKSIPPEKIKYVEYHTKSDLDEGIVIVDTPGLSSLNESHRKVLENFIEEADIVILTVTADQGLTKSAQDFLKQKLKEEVKTYIAITKSDLKPPKSIEEIKQYIRENFGDYFAKVIAVSAKNGDLEELKDVLKEISRKREAILEEKIKKGIQTLCKQASSIVSFQIENASLNMDDLNKRKDEIKEKLEKLAEEIKKIRERIKRGLDRLSFEAADIFYENMNKKVDWIVEGLYDENLEETIEYRFDKAIKESALVAFNFIERELKKSLEDADKSIEELQSKFDVGKSISIQLAESIVKFRERIADLVYLIPKIGPVLKAILKALLSSITRAATAAFVRKKVREAIMAMRSAFKDKVKESLEHQLDELFDESLQSLHAERDSYRKALEEIREKKKERREEFAKYLEFLKELELKFKECGEVMA